MLGANVLSRGGVSFAVWAPSARGVSLIGTEGRLGFQDLVMRLTRDHTIGRSRTTSVPVAPLVDLNATARDLKHILTNTIGMRGSVGPAIDLERFKLEDQDVVLVCTNGLTDALEESTIAKVLASRESPDAESRALVDLAMASGADDDVTALVAEYRIPS